MQAVQNYFVTVETRGETQFWNWKNSSLTWPGLWLSIVSVSFPGQCLAPVTKSQRKASPWLPFSMCICTLFIILHRASFFSSKDCLCWISGSHCIFFDQHPSPRFYSSSKIQTSSYQNTSSFHSFSTLPSIPFASSALYDLLRCSGILLVEWDPRSLLNVPTAQPVIDRMFHGFSCVIWNSTDPAWTETSSTSTLNFQSFQCVWLGPCYFCDKPDCVCEIGKINQINCNIDVSKRLGIFIWEHDAIWNWSSYCND